MAESDYPSLSQRVGAGIRGELARLEVSQTALARHLGLSLSSFRRRMHDETSFTVDEVESACQFFEIQPSELIRAALAFDAIRITANEVIVETN